jgi:aspartate dehydrogenase
MTKSFSVAIGGFGAIGMAVARKLDEGIEGLHLACVSARDREAAAYRMQNFSIPVPVVAASELAEHGDVVVECAPAAIFAEIAEPALKAGRIFMPLSVGQLLEHADYEDLARRHGGRIIVPAGALLGLDAVRAAAEGTIESVTMVTRKPPGGLVGAPYLEQQGISLDGLAKPLKIFDGTAREGARGFPANVNVAAALSLAGIGPDRTRLEIWADPAVTRNTHVIKVEADSTRFEMKIEGVPSMENPRTGKLTPLSVIATLRGLVSPMRVGT